MNDIKRVAFERINTLFEQALEVVKENPELANRYVLIARRIAMRVKIQLPRKFRRMICIHCKNFIYPGISCRVRIQPRRESHIVVNCFSCGKNSRIPLIKLKNQRRQ